MDSALTGEQVATIMSWLPEGTEVIFISIAPNGPVRVESALANENLMIVLKAIVEGDTGMTSYSLPFPEDGRLMTVAHFKESAGLMEITDADGYGHPTKDGKMARVILYPSALEDIPPDADHVIWFYDPGRLNRNRII